MKRCLILLLPLVFLLLSLPCFAYVVGDVNADNKVNLTEAIHALQVTAGARTPATAGAIINVPSQVATIQGAIDAAASGDTVNVAAGTYTEILTIRNKALTIQGAGAGSTIIAGISGSDTLTIDHAKVVSITGVTIQQGNNGIYARRGTAIEVSNTVVQDTADRGIRIVENSTARLSGVTVQRCAMDGISAVLSSSIIFSGTVASSTNQRDGVNIVDSSSAYFLGATVTTNANSRHGISVTNNSGLLVDGSSVTIQNNLGNSSNNGRGIQSFSGSSIIFQNSSSLLNEDNGLDGVGVGSAASFYVDATSTMTVRRAIRYGVNVWSNSNLQLNGTTLMENNAGNGVGISAGSSLFIFGTAGVVTIQNNVNNGMNVYQGTVHVDSPSMLTVSGTTGQGSGINVNNKSVLSVNGGLLVQNNSGTAGHGINISNGSQVTLYPASSKTVIIQNNSGKGINLWDGGSVVGGTGSGGTITITTGNTGGDLGVYFGSRASLPTSSYTTINCSQSYTTMMGVSCP